MDQALQKLYARIQERKATSPDSSYTAKLFSEGRKKIVQKFGEEAAELVIAAVTGDREETTAESADMLYHWLVLIAEAGITPEEVIEVLQSRENQSGLEEKAARKK